MSVMDRRRFLEVLGAGAALIASQSPSRADTDFFQGKTIRLLVAAQTGGGYDLTARVVAEFMGNHIPGKPSFVVQNMPGAGGLTMTKYLYNVAPKDGTVTGMPLNSLFLEPSLHLLSREGGNADFNLEKLNWIGTPVQDPAVLVISSKAFKSGKKAEYTIGAAGSGSDSNVIPVLCNGLLDTKFKLVRGYRGLADIILAFERGEIAAFATAFGSLTTSRPKWVTDGSVHFFAQFGSKRLAALPQVPTAIELAKGNDEKDMFRFFSRKYEAAFPIMAPPGVPSDRIETLRTAFDATMRDPQFVTKFKSTSLTLDPVSGREIERLVMDVGKENTQLVMRMRKILSESH
jgi:tripartite-type tricarboxylate transporter receptor subunit TctC